MENKDLADLYADTAMCLMIIISALDKNGAVSKAEILKSCEITLSSIKERPYHILSHLHAELQRQTDAKPAK